MSLLVVDPGLASLVVDLGRPRTRSLGVPVGGAADRAALILGNALVGNPPDAAALEVTLAGPTLRAQSSVGGIVFGAPFDLSSDRQRLRVGKSFTLAEGEELRIEGALQGMRAYLCVPGGFDSPTILSSQSALEPIRTGQVLTCCASTLRPRYLDISPTRERGSPPQSLDANHEPLRVIPGPQADWFPSAALPTFTVSPASNRMGLRLDGPAVRVPDREMVSEPVCPGAIQVTRDGQCIVLGVDGQTIGGYPKIAQVISADLDRLGQLRPGDAVTFQEVTVEEAERLYRERQDLLRRWSLRIRASLMG